MVRSLHHTGCLVGNIEEAIQDYLVLYPSAVVSEVYDIVDQKVKVCFFSIGSANIEFVEPAKDNKTLQSLLAKKPGFYHIGLYVYDIAAEIDRLESHGYRKINQFRSMAFDGNWCAFLYNNEMHLIELIESK